jgi:ferric-dicitrate binding protein FerR (iron transport regulator)
MRAASLILTALVLISPTACQVWKISPLTPTAATGIQGNPGLVRLTLNDGSEVRLDSPRISNDSIYGVVVPAGESQPKGNRIAFSLAAIRQVDKQHRSPGRTAALLAGIAGIVGLSRWVPAIMFGGG